MIRLFGVLRRVETAVELRRKNAKKDLLLCGADGAKGRVGGGMQVVGGGGSPGETRKVLYRMFECVEMYIKVVRNGHPQGQTPRPGGWLREGRGEEAFSLSLEK